MNGFIERQASDGRRERRAIENTQMLLGAEFDGFYVVFGQRLAR